MCPRILFLVSLFVAPWVSAETCRVVGSDWLAPLLEEKLPQLVSGSDVAIELDLTGSIPAKQQIRAGKANLAIIASAEKVNFGPDWRVVPFGFEVAMVAVHPENPLGEVNYEQLQGIFGVSENINRWTDLGLTGVWATRSIVPLLPPRDMGSSVLFRHDVLGGREVRPTVRWVEDVGAIAKRVQMDAGAIAVLPYTEKVEEVKILAVAGAEKDSVPFNPTSENIFYGDYPLRLPLYLVFPSQADSRIGGVVQVLLGKELASYLSMHGICPLPEKVRERTLLGLDFK